MVNLRAMKDRASFAGKDASAKVKKLLAKKEKTPLLDDMKDLQEERDHLEEDKDSTEPPKNKEDALKADIDRLKAESYALLESKKVVSERFMRVAEEIGGIREGLAEQEKELKNLLVRVTKSVDLVENVQPDALLKEVEKMRARFETTDGKIDYNKTVMDQVVKDLKDIRSQIGLFKGVEQTLKLNTDVNKKLQDIMKIKENAERHSDKVENIFVEFNKRFSRFEQHEKSAKALEDRYKNLISDVEKLRTHIKGFASSSDLDEAKIETEQEIEVAVDSVNDLKIELAKLQETVNVLQAENSDAFLAKLDELEKKIEDSRSGKEVHQLLSDLTSKVSVLEAHTGEDKSSYMLLANSIEQLRRDIYGMEERMDDIVYAEEKVVEIDEFILNLADYIKVYLKPHMSEEEIKKYLKEYNHSLEDVEAALKHLGSN